MRTVYQAAHIVDAHLVRGLLAQAGIPAFVLGEHLTGGLGELPLFGLIAVAVADSDGGAAMQVLDAWRAGDEGLAGEQGKECSHASDAGWGPDALPQPG